MMHRSAPKNGQPVLSAQLLGQMLVTLDGRVVDTSSSRRTRHVLAYLLLHRGAPVVPDVVMHTFWPDASPAAARNSFHVALTGVRRSLRAAWPGAGLERRHDTYRLASGITTWVDVEEFERLCREGRRADRDGDVRRALSCFAAADGLYGGDLLAEDPYADWVAQERESLRLQVLDVQRRLAELHAAAGDHASAVLVARRALAVDPCSEPMHRQLMCSYLATGLLHLALAQFHRCADELWKSHRIRPSAETVELNELLRCPQRPQTRRPATPGAVMADGHQHTPAPRHLDAQRAALRMRSGLRAADGGRPADGRTRRHRQG
jgi:SARP family transcriptional regulator, regulator of embCAB operon